MDITSGPQSGGLEAAEPAGAELALAEPQDSESPCRLMRRASRSRIQETFVHRLAFHRHGSAFRTWPRGGESPPNGCRRPAFLGRQPAPAFDGSSLQSFSGIVEEEALPDPQALSTSKAARLRVSLLNSIGHSLQIGCPASRAAACASVRWPPSNRSPALQALSTSKAARLRVSLLNSTATR